jgi:hypothetical protein
MSSFSLGSYGQGAYGGGPYGGQPFGGNPFQGFEVAGEVVTYPVRPTLFDDFDALNGGLTGYSADQGTGNIATPLPIRHHYDIRNFNATDMSVPFTQNDFIFWSDYKYPIYNVGDARPLGPLAGVETWSGGTIGKNSSYRYSNTLTVNVPVLIGDSDYGVSVYGVDDYGKTTNIYSSTFVDDLFTGFADPNRTYYIELVLRSFPAQGSGAYIDINNSYIDFSSDPTFSDPTQIDSLKFSSSLNDVSAGGDTYLQFPRTALVNAIATGNLTNIQGIQFRLKAVGGTATFTAQSLRMVDDQYTFKVIDTETKSHTLRRSVPQAGGTESSTPYGAIYFQNAQPKNLTYIVAFNSGHNASGGNDNTMRTYFRAKENGDHIEATLTARTTQSRLSIYQTYGGVATTIFQTPINTHMLTSETNYFMVIELYNEKVRASIYAVSPFSSIALGNLIYTTDWQIIQTTGVAESNSGFVGYSFEPYNYDFYLYFMGPQVTEYGNMISTNFGSRRLVEAATIYPITSPQVNVLTNLQTQGFGDVSQITGVPVSTVEADYGVSYFGTGTFGTIPPEPSIAQSIDGDWIVTRSGILPQGGIMFGPTLMTNNANAELALTGEIWIDENNGGIFRVAIIDKYDNVLWVQNLPSLLTKVWNPFFAALPTSLMPENVFLIIEQDGLNLETVFKLRNLALGYPSIAWYLSPDNGTTDSASWIAGYQLEPHYT